MWIGCAVIACALLAIVDGQTCLPMQKKCGDTCCAAAQTCCPESVQGCTPPNTTCCTAAPNGYCLAGEVCCQTGCSPAGSTCCGVSSCSPTQQCCQASSGASCFDPATENACCDGLGVYNTSESTCCNQAPAKSFPAVCPGVKQKCCYQHYDQPCFDVANSTCCPSVRYGGLNFIVPGEQRECCGDDSYDYACTDKSLVCCPTVVTARSLSAVSRRSAARPAPLPAAFEGNTEGTCANATVQFCCPFRDYTQDAVQFANTVPCALGDLCCPGGLDNTGVMRAGGCCFGKKASQWSCGVNGAPVCPNENTVSH